MTKFLGTEMYWAVFIITAIELLIGFYQIIHYLERPSDKKRLWYLTLLILLICYNMSSGFLPDPTIPVPIVVQNLIAYCVAIIMTIYFAYYLYKTYELQKLKRFMFYGSLYGLVLPFVVVFLIIYTFTLDIDLSRQLFVIAPAIYGIASAIKIGSLFYKKVQEEKLHRFDALSGYLAILCWIGLPFIVFFGDHQVLEHSFTNFGFLVLTVTRIRQSIYISHKEHAKLKESEESLKKLNEGLAQIVQEKTEHLEELMEQRTNVFVNLAHEIKTPLTLIQNQLDEYEQAYGGNGELTAIKHQHNKIARDVDNYFDIERMQRGMSIYKHNQIADISDILRQVIAPFRSYANKKQLTIIEQIDQGLCLQADPEAMECIVNNLIENAIKYSPPQSTIHIVLTEEEGKVLFQVQDHGIGIEESMITHIFDPFFQINSQKRNTDGMGLGLSIVNKIVDDLEGEIQVQSALEIGTTFKVYLNGISTQESSDFQATIQPYVQVKEHDLSDTPHDRSKASILIVEDSLDLLVMMRDYLKKDYNIYIAPNGEVAMTKLEAGIQIDLIISDIMMDGISGLELFEMLYHSNMYHHVPFIFLTAKNSTEDVQVGTELGAINYITKPFDLAFLGNVIKAQLENAQRQREVFTQKVWAYSQQSTTPLAKAKQAPSEIKGYGLTNKEKEVGHYLANTRSTYKEIANKLNVEESTIKTHAKNIYRKANVSSRGALFDLFQGIT